jgi:hypothetical protein
VLLALGVLNLWQRSEILAWQRKRRTTKKASIFFLISGGLLCMWMLTGNPVWDFNPETTTEELLRKIAENSSFCVRN